MPQEGKSEVYICFLPMMICLVMNKVVATVHLLSGCWNMMASTSSGSKCSAGSRPMNIFENGGSKCSVGATTYQQANRCGKPMFSLFSGPRYENVQEANVQFLQFLDIFGFRGSKCTVGTSPCGVRGCRYVGMRILSWKVAKWRWNWSSTVPVGPCRFLAMITSARPGLSLGS